MSLELYAAFVVTVTVLVMVPGPVIAVAVAHAVAQGGRRALATVAGASLSIVIQLAITAAGWTSLLLMAGGAFEVLRWVAAAYLVWLGIRTWRATPPADDGGDGSADRPAIVRPSLRALFLQGFLVSSTNPKSLVFYAAFFPQFLDPAAPPAPQLMALSATFMAIFSTGVSLYVLAAGRLGRVVTGAGWQRATNHAVAALLIGAGLGLALMRR